MIIRFADDKREGACEYLEQGSNGDRGKKDIRVQLTDLGCKETIGAVNKLLKKINKWDRYEDNYKHIILSFNGDQLSKEKMQEIVQDFLKLYMHAYDKDEYVWYAEAHIPKEKTNNNGEERRPHIHIFVHKYSPLLNRRLKFDTHPRRRQELNLIKNYLIKKYNLNYTFTNKLISKSKIDLYDNNKLKSKKELKKMIEQYILSNLQNYKSFTDMISDIKRTFTNIEQIKLSKNAKTPYISVKFRDFDRAIRFKGLLFSQETFQEARNSFLNNVEIKKYDPAYKLTLEEMLAEMQKRQEYLNKEIQRRFKTARKRKENLEENKEFLLFRELQNNNKDGINIKDINKIMFKLKLIQDYLQLAQSLALIPYLRDIGIINKGNNIKLVDKSKSINMDIMINGNNVNILSRGGMEEAKISAVIVADKIRKGELKKEDLIVQGTKEYKEAFWEELDKQLGEEKQIKREKQIKKESLALTI